MTGRRKGTPCACSDDCGCSSSKSKCIRAINNVSPDPNGDFNINAGTGIAISNGPNNEITIINSANPNAFVEGDNIDLIPSGDDIEIALTQDPVINGTLTVNGDIIQNGAAYETHAEQIYTRDDYIIMRDGAIAALAPGDYSGFQVKLYDGVNDGRLVIDNSGTARVGDVGDEQPLLTREENADLTDGDILEWDAINFKATDSGKKVSDFVEGSGNIGSDTYPVKIVNGVATASSRGVVRAISGTTSSITVNAGAGLSYDQAISGFTGTPVISIVPNGLPPGIGDMVWAITSVTNTSFKISLYNLGGSSATISFYYTVIGL